MLLPTADILEILPHRHPFLFVDRIVSLKSGQSAEGLYRVAGNHPFLNRMAARHVFPYTLVVEALGQVSAVCMRCSQPLKPAERRALGYLVRIDQCSFQGPVYVEDELLLSASLIAAYGSLYKFETVAKVEAAIVVKAALTLYLEL